MRTVSLLLFVFGLACGGGEPVSAPDPVPPPIDVPAPAAPDAAAWVDQAVDEAIAWEVMPGTTEEEDPARRPVLRAFFESHPEYADAEARGPLSAHACGLGGTEAAHEWLTHPPPRTPVTVEVSGDDWRVFVAHADAWCTSDDWSWYSSEANTGAGARGAVIAYGGPDNDAVVVMSEGREVARAALSGQGFLALRAGAPSAEIAYDPSAIESALDAYFGPPTSGD